MRLSATRVIDRPAPAVFAFVSDVSNNPRWQKGQVSCRWTSPPPVGIGSTYDQEARFLGRRLLSTFAVVEYEPGRSVTIKTVESSFPIGVRRSVESIDQRRSRVVAEITGEPGGFFRLIAPVVRRLAQRSVDADYDRLKVLLES